MSERAPVVCFHCGQSTASVDEGPRLNRLADGRPCPACADRLLRSLPSLVRDVALELERIEHEEHDSGSYLPDEPA